MQGSLHKILSGGAGTILDVVDAGTAEAADLGSILSSVSMTWEMVDEYL